MKNNLLKFAIIIFALVNLTGCIATHMGNMTGSASLSAPNFGYIKTNVIGESQATYILGIGGESKQSLVLEAKKNMLVSNPLRPNQALANVSVSYKTTHFLGILISTVECIVSADIVEFGSTNPIIAETLPQIQNPATPSPVVNAPVVDIKPETKSTEVSINTPIKVGDKVKLVNYTNKPIEGKVIEIKNGMYTVEYKNANNKIKKTKVFRNSLEKINP